MLSKALEETEYVAIAKLTMHNREYTVFLRPYKGGMMLHTMYYKEEVRELENFGRPDVELRDAEIKVAHQLIEALAGDFEPEKYHDTFEENLKTLIKARLEGEEVTAGGEAEEDGSRGRPDGGAEREPGADAEEATATRRSRSARVGDQGGNKGREVQTPQAGSLRGKIRHGRSCRIAGCPASRHGLVAGSPDSGNEAQTSAGYKFAKWPAVNVLAGASNPRHSPS